MTGDSDSQHAGWAIVAAIAVGILLFWSGSVSRNDDVRDANAHASALETEATRRGEEIQALEARLAKIPSLEQHAYTRGFHAGGAQTCSNVYSHLTIIVSTEDGNALSYRECLRYMAE